MITQLQELKKSLKNAKHEYHSFCLSTINSDAPSSRIVILRDFNKNLLEESKILFNNKTQPINKIIDKNINTFSPFKSNNNNVINITLENEKLVDIFEISENINLGQRIKEFIFEIKVNEKWIIIEKGTTVGTKRLIKLQIPVFINHLFFHQNIII